DCVRLEHLFINLFLNALNAMQASGGTLRIEVKEQDSGVQVDVRDTGSGIKPESLPHIFDAFFTTRANGTGLGLFSAKRIVEEHSGKIDVTSQPGHGATFSVWLPAGSG